MRDAVVNVGIGLVLTGVAIEFAAVARRLFRRSQMRPTLRWYALGFYLFYAGVAVIIGAKVIL